MGFLLNNFRLRVCGQAPPSSMALMVSNSSVANLAFAAGGLQLSSLKARNGAIESLAWRPSITTTIFSHCVSVRSGSLWLRRSAVEEEEEEVLWKPKKPASASSTSLRLRRIRAAANESTSLFFFFFLFFFPPDMYLHTACNL